ncbi:MAG: glycosyltransferase, partial [Planctomycetia bacterium]
AERRELQQQIARLGRRNEIRLIGQHPCLAEFYDALDVFALSSLREGLPNVVLEAMAVGVPVVATRVAGVPEVIEAGSNGLLCEPGDIHDLQRTLHRLLTVAALRRRFAAAGRRPVVEKFDFSARMRRMANVYDEVLGRPRAVEERQVRNAA